MLTEAATASRFTQERSYSEPLKPRAGVAYMPHLDGVRALAVIAVIVEHWASGLPRFLRDIVESLDLGGLGVECFFVLSGFLITLILLESKGHDLPFRTALGHFYMRRVLRIFPAYYLALLIALALFPQMQQVVAWHALYLANFYPLRHDTWPSIGGHFWSLSLEEQFYLFWPLAVLALPMRRVVQVAAFCCLLAPLSRLLIWTTMGGHHPSIATLPLTALDLLCFGALLACFRHHSALAPQSKELRWLVLAGVIALFLYLLLFFQFRHTPIVAVIGRSLTALFCGAFIVMAANGFKGPAKWLLGNSMAVWIGMISYGLYIFHPFIPAAYHLILDSLGLSREIFGVYYIRYPILLAMLLVVTSASFYFIERPIRQLRKVFV